MDAVFIKCSLFGTETKRIESLFFSAIENTLSFKRNAAWKVAFLFILQITIKNPEKCNSNAWPDPLSPLRHYIIYGRPLQKNHIQSLISNESLSEKQWTGDSRHLCSKSLPLRHVKIHPFYTRIWAPFHTKLPIQNVYLFHVDYMIYAHILRLHCHIMVSWIEHFTDIPEYSG